MAEIDRLMAASPAPAPAAGGPPAPAVGRPAPVPGRAASVTGWLRVLMVVALAVALPFWPFGRACGSALALYLGAVAALGTGALLAAVTTFRRAMGRGHVVALLCLAWAGVLAAREVLPRIGYAAHPLAWACEAAAAAD